VYCEASHGHRYGYNNGIPVDFGSATWSLRIVLVAAQAAALHREAPSSYIWKIVGAVMPLLTNHMKNFSVILQVMSSMMDVLAVFLVLLGVLMHSPSDVCLSISS
jgi:hypothetical protein